MIQCPVCEKAGLSEDLNQCPQCHADLECFELLDKLDDPAVTTEISKKNTPIRWQFSIFFIFIMLMLIVQTFYLKNKLNELKPAPNTALPQQFQQFSKQLLKKIQLQTDSINKKVVINTDFNKTQFQSIDQKLSALEQPLLKKEMLKKEVLKRVEEINNLSAKQERATETIKERLTAIEQKLVKLISKPTTPPPRTPDQKQFSNQNITYQSQKDETLWSIAKKFYGKGLYYPVLLTMNPGLTTYNHMSYGEIKIINPQLPNQQQLLIKIYKQK